MIYTVSLKSILTTLARHSILVGSAARGIDGPPSDLDLLVTPKGLDLAYFLLPDPVQISHSGNRIRTTGMSPPIDCFLEWAGPDAAELLRAHHAQVECLPVASIFGVRFYCWKGGTR